MTLDPKNGLQCSQFEALLSDALDDAGLYAEGAVEAESARGTKLTAEQKQAFDAHRAGCAMCGPMFAEILQGMTMLRDLPEVEPPKNLVHNILARTSGEENASAADAAPVKARATRWYENLRPTFAVLLHSRFATSFAMAFFSLSLTLTLAGVKITDIAKIDWRPNAVRKSVALEYANVEARVMRYYDNMRVVYEMETRVQKFKKATTPPNNRQQNRNRPAPNDNGRPEKRDNVVQERDVPAQIARTQMNETGPTGVRSAEQTRVDGGAQL